ncbi:MAG TPA: hypothetical protein DCS87_13945 [Rheinheimera sp.]|nr:hypothetical protein [Rheinheimera sp.]
MVDSSLQVKAASAKGGAALMTSAAIALVIFVTLYQLMPEVAPTQVWLLLMLLQLVALYVGGRKLAAPVVCIDARDDGMRYIHNVGSYLLPWQLISRIGIASLDGRDSGYIGIRLHSYDEFLQQVPLRLAVRLLIEQRDLLLIGMRHACPTGQCPSDLLVETGDFQGQQQTFRGVQAMFAHRMSHLRAAWNYDLFIPADFLELQPTQICLYLNQKRLQNSSQCCSGHD